MDIAIFGIEPIPAREDRLDDVRSIRREDPMKMKQAFLAALIAFGLGGPAAAGVGDHFELGLNFRTGFPTGEFRRNIDRAGYGGDFSFAYRIPRTIVSAGASFGFLIYGSESRNEPLSSNIPDVVVRVRTTNSILLGHLFVRLQPRTGRIRPYLEGLAGFLYLTTDTSIGGRDQWSDTLSSNNFNDTAFSAGLGGGTKLALLQVKRAGRSEGLFSLDLDLGLRWLRGGRAEYLKKGSIHREGGLVYYDVYESRTDLWLAGLGLSFAF
jgi:hypothetical protein